MDLKVLRILVQIMNCMQGFGGYYLSDLPGAIGTGAEGTIESHFIHHNQTYTQSMNLGLYSAYSWPSILTIFSGILIDTILGRSKATILFSVSAFLGAVLFWVGVAATNYPLMVFSRILLGFGSESITVSQSAYVTRWFKDLPLGLSIAQSLTVVGLRVAAASNFLISPVVGEHSGATTASFVGVIFSAISLACTFGTVFLDNKAVSSGVLPEKGLLLVVVTESQKQNRIVGGGSLEDEGISRRRDTTTTPVDATTTTTDSGSSGGSGGGGGKLNCNSIKQLPLSMWIVCIGTTFVYMALFPLISIAENFFQVQYGFTHESSGQPVSVYQITSAVGLLFSGFAVDYIGNHSIFLIIAMGLITLVHVLFLTTTVTPYIPMVLFATGYFLMVSSLWTIPPFLVPESSIGVSYGIMTAFLNLGLAVLPLASGAILDVHTPPKENGHTQLPTLAGYKIVLALFATVGALGTLSAVWLYVVDRRSTRALCSSPAQRNLFKDNLSDISEPLHGDLNDDESGDGDQELKSTNRLSALEGGFE